MTAQASLLKQKYDGRKVDLLIAGLSSGLDFVLAHRDDLFPAVPVVHIAVDQREVKARHLPPDVIGVPIWFDLEKTLELALRLHPDTRRVFVVAGSAPFDAEWEAEARRTFQHSEGRIEFVYLTGLPTDELLRRVESLPERSVVYYLHIYRDGAGKHYSPADALELLAARANAPIYGNVDTYVGRGIVGGHVLGFEREGTAAARLGLRILAGEKPEAIQVLGASENTYVFDWQRMRQWGVREGDLPPGSVVRHKEPTVWDDYKWQIIAAASFGLLQAVLIVGLLIQRQRQRRAVDALKESEARFRQMADAAPVMIWAAGPDKGTTYYNRPWLEFTGRPLDRELGDGWAEGVHPDDRRRCLEVYAAGFDSRRPFEMAYRLRRHDGEYRWVQDRGVPRFTPDGEFVGYIGVCSDVTDRRRAEEGLRALPGRLLEAQETERRRIARELHDDLNQSLALLAVEIDALVQTPPASRAELAARMGEVAAQVKDLSTAVHDLSHELHPSKLEHLGLVASVRALCRDVSLAHGLEVTFTHFPDPGTVPPETSHCLYRLVQEALRNVVKHSGCRHASVDLSATAGAIHLSVEDDGVGFDPGPGGHTGGLGLVSMRERLHLIGGTIAIDSRPGEGTRIDIHAPVPGAGLTADREPASSVAGR
jgi:PAS domain S-box-containing protein